MSPLQFALPAAPELLVVVVLFLLYLIVPIALAYWVQTDADRRGDDNAALWALAVGGLTYLTFFGGILALLVSHWDRE